MHHQLDPIDLKILRLLQADESLTNEQIGNAVFRSASSVYARIRKLENLGIIEKRMIVINPEKLNLTFNAHIFICMKGYSYGKREEFRIDLKHIVGISNVIYYGGIPNIAVHVTTNDMRNFLAIEKKISSMDKVLFIHSAIVLENIKINNGLSF